MGVSAMLNKKHDAGVTLVEVLIALVILLIVFLGLTQSSLLIIDQNTRNEARDTAVRIASDSIYTIQQLSSGTLPTGSAFDVFLTTCDENNAVPVACNNIDPVLDPPGAGIQVTPPQTVRTIRNKQIIYTITTTVQVLDIENKQVTVTVSYQYIQGAGQPVYTQTLNSIMRRS
jgi:prepilin-type N-terminal cleavage/methylation domain-containing protein